MTGKIKILQLGSPTGLYGAERWILALIRHLDPIKFESLVAAIKDDSSLEVPLCAEASKLGFKTHIFHIKGRFNLSAIPRLKNFICENNVNILHTHAYKQDIIGLAATINTNCKIITTPHGWSRESDFKLKFYELFDRAIFPFFDSVVPLSEDLYQPLKHIPGLKNSKLILIKNGVDISEIDSVRQLAPEIIKCRNWGEFIIGYIGQLINRKGVDILLKAVANLPNSINWRLVIVGEGEKRQMFEKLAKELHIKNRTMFLGFREDRIELLKGFNVFVLPSRLEGIPRCLMEAMAAEIPVIASDIPGCRDLIKDRINGLLFPLEDYQNLSEFILHIINLRHDSKKALISNARNFVLENYSAKRMAEEYENLFYKLRF